MLGLFRHSALYPALRPALCCYPRFSSLYFPPTPIRYEATGASGGETYTAVAGQSEGSLLPRPALQ